MLSYDPEIIPHIPSLDDADRSVKESATFAQFLSEFKALVTSAGLQDSLGVTLVHHHANVPLGSRMMDFKQTLQPFSVETTAKSRSMETIGSPMSTSSGMSLARILTFSLP